MKVWISFYETKWVFTDAIPKPTTVVRRSTDCLSTRNKDSWCVVLTRGRLQFPDNLQPQWSRVEQSIFHELCQEVLQLFTTSSGSRVDKIPDKHGRTLFNQCRICQKGIPRMLRLHRWSPDPLGRLSLRLPELLLREGGLPNPWLQRDSSA